MLKASFSELSQASTIIVTDQLPRMGKKGMKSGGDVDPAASIVETV